jgi:hypothetical protein
MKAYPDYVEESELEREALGWCALRLDGWRLLKEVEGQDTGDFSPYVDLIVKERRLHQDDRLNHLAFFALQRYLGKFGGEDRTPYSDEHIAYRFLFLHLYRQPVPRGFESQDFPPRWNEDFAPRAEEIAAKIRGTFSRKGAGPESAYDLQRTNQGEDD